MRPAPWNGRLRSQCACWQTQWDPQGRRLVSTFLDPNLAGGLIVVALLLACARIAAGDSVPLWRPGVLVTALVMTVARSSFLGFVVGLAVLVFLVRRVTWKAIIGALLATAAFAQESLGTPCGTGYIG